MMRALAWKECREQSTVWVAVAVMGAIVLAGMAATLHPSELTSYGPLAVPVTGLVLMSIAAVYGLACGASMFAGEIEARTLPFLDSLPATRASLWTGKVLVGLILSLAQGVLLALVGLTVGPEMNDPIHLLWALPLVCVEAFAWGLVGSALFGSALPAAGVAAVPLAFNWLLGGAMFWPPPLLGVVLRSGVIVLVLLLSLRMFCAPDIARRDDSPLSLPEGAKRSAGRGRARDNAPSALGALVWLTLRQGWIEVCVLGGLALLEGFFLPAGGLAQWLIVTLLVGVFCGTGTFRDEQMNESARFLGEQRIPPTPFWAVKLGLWLLLALGLTIAVLCNGTLAALSADREPTSRALRVFGEKLLLSRDSSGVLLMLGVAYGFAVGQLVALVVRKAPVAVVLAALLAALAGIVWLPSAINGGLPAWQALVVPVLLLAAGWLVRREWAADHLASRRGLLTLGVSLALAVLWTAGALAWRVIEVPAAGEPFDVKAFEASIPSLEKNTVRTLIRRAAQGMTEREQQLVEPQKPQGAGMMGGVPGMPPGGARAGLNYHDGVVEIVGRGWEGATPELARWLDQMFEGDWPQQVREAVEQPFGVIEDPRFLNILSPVGTLPQCHSIATLFTARALQLQAAGQERESLRYLTSVLALSRHLRNRAIPLSWTVGLRVEQTAFSGLEHWLARPRRTPELLREALNELARHESELPPPTDAVKAEYLVVRNTLSDSDQVIRLGSFPSSDGSLATGRWTEAACQAPWERMRLERIANAVVAGRLRAAQMNYWQFLQQRASRPGASREMVMLSDWTPASDDPHGEETRRRLGRVLESSWFTFVGQRGARLDAGVAVGRARVRGFRLVLALMLYRIEQGKTAPDLAVLVRRYLPDVPIDPCDGQPFRYRVSAGERIPWPEIDPVAGPEAREVSPGQGIVWSVGTDGEDNSAVRMGEAKGTDLIFLVPLPAKR